MVETMTYWTWPWTDWQCEARWDDWTWRRGLAAATLVLASTLGCLLLVGESISVSFCDFMGAQVHGNTPGRPKGTRRPPRARYPAVKKAA